MRKPHKNTKTQRASMHERGSQADLAKRVSKLEAEVASMKAGVDTERFEAFRRDVRAGVEQLEQGNVRPWDVEAFWQNVKTEVARRS